MTEAEELNINCSEFEELLTDYLDGVLERGVRGAAAAHALRCPLCHSLLNEVKDALEVCHKIAAPKASMTKLEARILSMTMPETAMSCQDFEEYLTDYLDGFLPAALFHRWERHAVLCEKCTDLPGEVVRSIAACYSFKNEEMPLPEGMHERILQATIGTANAQSVQPSIISQIAGRLRNLSFPISIPQLAPVAVMIIFAVFILTQTVSTDGSIGGMYRKSFELAEQTYREGAGVLRTPEIAPTNPQNQAPVQGTYINDEGK